MRRLTVVLIAIALAVPALGIAWSRGGLFGADVRALAIDPAKPDVIYLGTSHGEVYRSRDGARSWANPRGTLQFPGYVVDNLAVDGRGRLWAAAWGLWGGGLVAFSDDGGANWTRRDDGIRDMSIRAFALVSGDEDTLLVGGLSGIYRSVDSGANWEKISDQENVESLAVDPRSADVIFAGTWRQAFRTDDGGKSWKHIAKGMVLDTDVFGININPSNPDDVWLSTCGWVYHSKNRGEKWTRYRDGFENRRVHVVERDTVHPQWVYAGTVAGLYRTLDLGKSWERISDENLVIRSIGVHPARPDRIILGTEGDGVYVSEDHGKTFRRSADGLYNVRVAGLVADPLMRGRLYAAVLFGGASSGIYESVDSGATWTRLNRTILPEVLTLILHDDGKEPILLAGTERGIYWSVDGVEWTHAEPTTEALRVQKLLSYNRERLFAATSDGVFTSKDGGRSWYRLFWTWDRTADIAIGLYGGKTALYSLGDDGLRAFNENGWHPIKGAPNGSRVMVRAENGGEVILVAGAREIRSGRVTAEGRWEDLGAESSRNAAHVVGKARTLVRFRSDDDRHLFLASGAAAPFAPTGLSLDARDVVSVVGDPFADGRLYVGTAFEGVYVLDEAANQRQAPATQFGGRK